MSSSNHNNRRKGHLASTSDVLQSLLQNSQSPLSQGFTRWKLWHHWSEVMGDSMAQHSAPVGYSKGVLYIWVDSSARMQEMIFLIRSIQNKINSYLGKRWVKSIKFTLDRKSVPQHALADEELKNFLQK